MLVVYCGVVLREMNRKPSRHLSHKIDMVMVDGELLSVSELVWEINRLNGRPIGDVNEVALASMVAVLKGLRRKTHGA